MIGCSIYIYVVALSSSDCCIIGTPGGGGGTVLLAPGFGVDVREQVKLIRELGTGIHSTVWFGRYEGEEVCASLFVLYSLLSCAVCVCVL
jgi:hypothetical protein